MNQEEMSNLAVPSLQLSFEFRISTVETCCLRRKKATLRRLAWHCDLESEGPPAFKHSALSLIADCAVSLMRLMSKNLPLQDATKIFQDNKGLASLINTTASSYEASGKHLCVGLLSRNSTSPLNSVCCAISKITRSCSAITVSSRKALTGFGIE